MIWKVFFETQLSTTTRTSENFNFNKLLKDKYKIRATSENYERKTDMIGAKSRLFLTKMAPSESSRRARKAGDD